MIIAWNIYLVYRQLFRSSHDYHGDLLHPHLPPGEDHTPQFRGVWRGGLSHQEEREELFQDVDHNIFKVCTSFIL